MRIVNIEDFFHPNAGYQINILPKYMVKLGHETYIVTAQMESVPENLTKFFGKKNIEKYDKEYENSTGVKIIRVPVKKFVSGRAIFDKNINKIVDDLNPDILYVHGNDTAIGMKYIWEQKKNNIPLITDSHMLEMASINPFNKLFRAFYKYFITPQIIKNQLTVIRTQDDNYVDKCLGIPLKQCPWISYGSDTMLFYPDEEKRKQFRQKNEISQEAFVIIYAGKLDETKGGVLLAEALKDKFDTNKKVVFLIVGNAVGEYGEQVEKLFNESQNTILRFPTQRYVDLAKFYQSADLAVFPRQCSLSFYDVQACSLPVISEDNDINVARCSHGNGAVFKSGDLMDFRDNIQKYINMDNARFQKVKQNALSYIKAEYDYAKKADEYMNEINKTIQRYEKSEKYK